MQPTLEDQERHLLVKVIDRVLYKLDELVRPYVLKSLVVIEPLLIDEDYYARVEGREIIFNLSKAASLATMIAANNGAPNLLSSVGLNLIFQQQIPQAWEVPVSVLLKLTIPQISPSEWSRFYQSANIALCTLALLYSCKSFVPLDHPIIFLFPNSHFPLWLVVICGSGSLAILHYIIEKEPPKTEQIPVVVLAFVMSVFWISTTAGELLNCLVALGVLLELSPALLGLIVLAWGNSVGDLVADVAVAKAGHPTMAMAGCFARPMFNMLFGLG